MKNRTVATAALALATALALAGCTAGNTDEEAAPESSSTSTQAADFNDADVMFATMMIPHHEQAIEMSDMVLGEDGVDTAVADLAQEIKGAQGPEIEQLEAWLTDWGVDSDDAGGMDHGGMDGMMSEDDMAELEAADGAEASRLFLEQMIEHHEGAVEMALTQLDDGQNPDAVALAQDIVDAQTGEIDQMRDMLADL